MRFQSLNAHPTHLLSGLWVAGGEETKGARAGHVTWIRLVTAPARDLPLFTHKQTANTKKSGVTHTHKHTAIDSPKRLILARDFYEPYLQSDPVSTESILIWLHLSDKYDLIELNWIVVDWIRVEIY